MEKKGLLESFLKERFGDFEDFYRWIREQRPTEKDKWELDVHRAILLEVYSNEEEFLVRCEKCGEFHTLLFCRYENGKFYAPCGAVYRHDTETIYFCPVCGRDSTRYEEEYERKGASLKEVIILECGHKTDRRTLHKQEIEVEVIKRVG